MSEIPHPFVEESLALFDQLPVKDKFKVHFIHFNHSNPAMFANSPEHKEVLDKGYRIARDGMIFKF